MQRDVEIILLKKRSLNIFNIAGLIYKLAIALLFLPDLNLHVVVMMTTFFKNSI